MSPFECAGRMLPSAVSYVRCESGCQLTERNSAEKTPAIPIVKILTEVTMPAGPPLLKPNRVEPSWQTQDSGAAQQSSQLGA